jgi:hypothetical protein
LLQGKQIQNMADGGCDIEDDDCLRDSVAKTLLEIGELKSELENKLRERERERHCAWLKAAEAAKKEEGRVEAEGMERRNREEKRKAQEKAMELDEEEERKKWEQVLATQRETSEKEKSKREREKNAKKEEDKQERLRKHQEQKLQQRQEQNNMAAERQRKEREREREREAQKRLEEQERREKFDKEAREREERVAKEGEDIGKVLKQEDAAKKVREEAAKKVREREHCQELEIEKRKLELERQRRQREREARDRLEQAAKARKKKAEEETGKKKAQEFRPLYRLQLELQKPEQAMKRKAEENPKEAVVCSSAAAEEEKEKHQEETTKKKGQEFRPSRPLYRLQLQKPEQARKKKAEEKPEEAVVCSSAAAEEEMVGSAEEEENHQEETFETRCALCAPQAHGLLAISSSEVPFRNVVERRVKEGTSSSPDWQGADLHDVDLSDAASRASDLSEAASGPRGGKSLSPVQDTSSYTLTPVDWFQLSNSFTPETQGTNVSTGALNTMAEEQQHIRKARAKMNVEESSAHAQVSKDEKQETERLFMSKFFGDEDCDTYGCTSLRYDVGASEFNNLVGPYGADGLLKKMRVQLDEAGVLTGRKQALDELDVKYRCAKTASEVASKAVRKAVGKRTVTHILNVRSDGGDALLMPSMPSMQAPKKTWTPNVGASEFKVKTAN